MAFVCVCVSIWVSLKMVKQLGDAGVKVCGSIYGAILEFINLSHTQNKRTP